MGRRAAEASAGAAREGAPAARHRRQRQPLRGHLRRRDGSALGRCALRQPRLRAHGRVGVPRAGAGKGVGRSCAGARGASAARCAARARLLAPDESRGPVRVRRPRVGRAKGRGDPRRTGDAARAQPSQLRVEGDARWRGGGRDPQGSDPRLSRSARLHRRLDGRRRRDRARDRRRERERRRASGAARGPLQHRARCGTRHVAHRRRRQAEPPHGSRPLTRPRHPRDDAVVGAREGRDPARWWARREPARLPTPSRRCSRHSRGRSRSCTPSGRSSS